MNNILECHNISKYYGKNLILDNINISIKGNAIIGLLGKNGSGKTTFFKIIAGAILPSSGTMKVNNINIGNNTKELVSFLPERNSLFNWLKIKEMVIFYNNFYLNFRLTLCERLLRKYDLNPDSYIWTLSKGTKRKLKFILSISRDAKLYCFDEPFSGIDSDSKLNILKSLHKYIDENSSIIMSAHDIDNYSDFFSSIIYLSKGSFQYEINK